jgi:hypothetical protein
MRLLFQLLLVLSISMAASVRAESDNVDLNQYSIFSVVYSSAYGRALVGLGDNEHEIAFFAECNAPHGEPDQRIMIKDLSICREVPNSRFIYTEGFVDKINQVFPDILKRVYAEEYKSKSADTDLGLGPPQYLSVIAGAVGTGLGLEGFASAPGAFAAGQRGAGTLRLGVGIAGTVLAVGSLWYYFYSQMHSGRNATVPSLDALLIKSYQTALKKNPTMTRVDFDDRIFLFSFDVLRRAIVQSISDASTI